VKRRLKQLITKAAYSTSSSTNTTQHFQRAVQGYHVQVVELKNKGRGVKATKDFKEGDVLFSEIPIALARSMHSHFPPVTATHQMHHSNFCSYCLKSLAQPKAALPDTFPSGHSLPLPERFWPKAESPHSCSECVVEKYCSEKCKKVGTAAYHHLMCIGAPPNREHPLVELQLQCMKYDINYPILAARMLAMSATLFSRLRSPDEDAMWDISPFSKFYTSSQPLPSFAKNPELKEFVYETAYDLIHEAMESQAKKYPKCM